MLKEARRMKCCVLVFSSQMMRTVSLAMAIREALGPTAAQPRACSRGGHSVKATRARSGEVNRVRWRIRDSGDGSGGAASGCSRIPGRSR